MRFRIPRHFQDEYWTKGTIFTEDQVRIGVIMERPFVDRDNDGRRDPNVCRINQGSYRAIKRESPKRGHPVWWLCGVPDVNLAYFPGVPDVTTSQLHRATWPWQLEGCLGIGTAFGQVEYRDESVRDGPYPREKGRLYPGITGSRLAFDRFMSLTEDEEEIWLDIVDNFGAPAGTWA